MTKNLKFIITCILLLISPMAYGQYNNEYEVQNLLEEPQKNEITLFNNASTLVALEENETDGSEIFNDVTDSIEQKFQTLEEISKPEKNNNDSLWKKVLHSEISRTDVPSYLLKDALTFEYEKGPIKELQFFGAYRGSINPTFNAHTYSTKYETQTNEVGIMGKFANPDLGFRMSVQPVPSSSRNYFEQFILDFYLTYSGIPHHKILIGRSRGQVGLEGGSSAYLLPFVARSQIARYFGNTRSAAVNIIGDYNYIDYLIGYGSSGRQFTSGMPGTEFTGVLNLKPLGSNDGKYGKITIGGTFNAGHNGINYTIGSAYIKYNHKRLMTSFEAAIADGYNGSKGVSSNKACGYTYTISWDLTKKLQILGRIDQFDPNRDVSHDLKREYSIGLNYFVKGTALRLILDWVFCHNQNAPNSHKIIVGTQILL